MSISNSKFIPTNILKENDVDIWITIPAPITNIDLIREYRSLLSSDEIIKVDRYKFEKDRNNALITRVFVRDLLSKYSGIKANELLFETSKNGKPELKNCSTPLRFNLTHTKDMIVCAITLDNNIGCDIENIDRKIDIRSIAKRYFGDNEVSDILNQPAGLQASKFFKFWTLKEAFVKSTGDGLAKDLSDIRFAIDKPDSVFINKNISLTYRDQIMKNWFHCIIFPDPSHCLSLSINSPKDNFNIRVFKGEPLLESKQIFYFES